MDIISFKNFLKLREWEPNIKIPSEYGVYFIFLKSLRGLPHNRRSEWGPMDKPLYIGKTKDLGRCLHEHFCGSSASSTLRRSVGAMMKDTLPLGASLPTLGSTEFKFEHEKPLSDWFQQNCWFYFEVGKAFYDEEVKKIGEFKPPFNREISKRVKNPNVHPLLDDAIRVCEEEARRNTKNAAI